MFLCCGDALIDMLPCEDTRKAAAFSPMADGDAFYHENKAERMRSLADKASLRCQSSAQIRSALNFGVKTTAFCVRRAGANPPSTTKI